MTNETAGKHAQRRPRRGGGEMEGEVAPIWEGSVRFHTQLSERRSFLLHSSRFTRNKVRPLTVLLNTRWRYVYF